MDSRQLYLDTLESSFKFKKSQDRDCILKIAATYVSKKCSCILELYKVINVDANYVYQVEIVPLNKLITYVLICIALLLLIVPTWY